jgi:hypothetical protein
LEDEERGERGAWSEERGEESVEWSVERREKSEERAKSEERRVWSLVGRVCGVGMVMYSIGVERVFWQGNGA